MNIHKNLLEDIPNIFPYQNVILIEKLHSQITFCMVTTLMVHPRIMNIHKNLPGDIPNIFPYKQIQIQQTITNFLYGDHPNGIS